MVENTMGLEEKLRMLKWCCIVGSVICWVATFAEIWLYEQDITSIMAYGAVAFLLKGMFLAFWLSGYMVNSYKAKEAVVNP